MPDLIRLGAGHLVLGVSPAGGTIVSFQLDRGQDAVNLLRPAAPHDIENGDPLGASAFPLVPFFAFARSGSIAFEGKEWPMAPNHASEAFPLHGDGWLAEWKVERADDTSATLTYRHDSSGGYPFPYRARLDFDLDAVALTYAFLESGHIRQPVSFKDVAADRVNGYQAEINEAAGLV